MTRITPRQREVWRLIALGKTTKGAAVSLGVSFHTVRDHKMSLYRSLEITCVVQLTLAAVQHGIIDAEDIACVLPVPDSGLPVEYAPLRSQKACLPGDSP